MYVYILHNELIVIIYHYMENIKSEKTLLCVCKIFCDFQTPEVISHTFILNVYSNELHIF